MENRGVPDFRKQAPGLAVVFICLLVVFLAVGAMNGRSDFSFFGMIAGGTAGLAIFLGADWMAGRNWKERALREPEPLQDERTNAVAKQAMLKSLQVTALAIGVLIILTLASPLKNILSAMNVLIVLIAVIFLSMILFAVYYGRKGTPD